jgi:hypothetical protein
VRIVTCHFEYGNSEAYNKLSKVFEFSVKKNIPDIELEIVTLPKQDRVPGKIPVFATNTIKLGIWADIMATAVEPIIFCDADLLLLKDPTPAFDADFDVCFTRRTAKIPFNGGVVFTRPTDQAKKFFSEWKEVNRQMYLDPIFHRAWRKKYAGMNQAALGYILEKNVCDAKIHYLPCSRWNACDEEWETLSEDTVFLHVKGWLRATLLGNKPKLYEKYKIACNLWKDYEQAMLLEYGPMPKKVEEQIIKKKQKKSGVILPNTTTFVHKPPTKPRVID